MNVYVKLDAQDIAGENFGVMMLALQEMARDTRKAEDESEPVKAAKPAQAAEVKVDAPAKPDENKKDEPVRPEEEKPAAAPKRTRKKEATGKSLPPAENKAANDLTSVPSQAEAKAEEEAKKDEPPATPESLPLDEADKAEAKAELMRIIKKGPEYRKKVKALFVKHGVANLSSCDDATLIIILGEAAAL